MWSFILKPQRNFLFQWDILKSFVAFLLLLICSTKEQRSMDSINTFRSNNRCKIQTSIECHFIVACLTDSFYASIFFIVLKYMTKHKLFFFCNVSKHFLPTIYETLQNNNINRFVLIYFARYIRI